MDMYATLRYIYIYMCVCARVHSHNIYRYLNNSNIFDIYLSNILNLSNIYQIFTIHGYLILFQGIVSKKKPCIAAALESAT